MTTINNQAAIQSLTWERRLARTLGRDWLLAYLFILPVLLVMVGLIAYPFFYALSLSMQNKMLGGEGVFIGFGNYIYLVLQPVFQRAALNSLIYTVAGVLIKFVIGLAMALVLNSAIRMRNLWRALLFVPWSIPIVVSAFTWRWMYDDLNGVFNTLLARMGLIDHYIFWLGDPKLALWAVIIAMVWQGTPFYCMNFIAGLQSIPKELYDAAKIDGANRLREFRYITLPSLSGVIMITLLLSTIWTANELQFVFVLTQGGPANYTQIYPFYAYETSIRMRQLGLGAAVPLTFFPLLVTAIILLTRLLLRQEK